MKKIILIIALALSVSACVPPVLPVPPVGCSSSDAVLITNSDGSCYWVFMDCGY